MTLSKNYKISIIVPTGRPETAFLTVKSVLDQDNLPDNVEIVLAGAAIGELAEHFSDERIITVVLEKRLNPAATRMAGIAAATGNIYLFVDDDVELERSFVTRLVDVLDRGSRLGAVGARLPGKDKTYFSRVTDLTNFWSQQSRCSGKRDWLYSAVLAVPAKVYHEVGGFNQQLAIGEDVDLTQRIRQAGYSVCYEADLVGYHNHRRTVFGSTLSYFWHNGGLAKYLFQQDRQLRIFSMPIVCRNFFLSVKNSIRLNRKEYPGFLLYFPGILFMYLVFNISLEHHRYRYMSSYINDNVSMDNIDQQVIANPTFYRALCKKFHGGKVSAFFFSLLAFFREMFGFFR